MRLLICLAVLFAVAAAPATAPSTQPVSSYPALQKKLAELQAVVARLAIENEGLKKDLAAALAKLSEYHDAAMAKKADEQALPQTASALRSAVVDKLKIGMKTDAVVALLGPPREKSRDGEFTVYEYTKTDPGQTVGNTYYPGETYSANCYFDATGTLADIRDGTSKGGPIQSGKAPAQDGRH